MSDNRKSTRSNRQDVLKNTQFISKSRGINTVFFRYVTKAILRNLKRSSTIIIAMIITISITTSLFMWIETSPRLAIKSSMTERAYEIQVGHIIYPSQNDRIEEIQQNLKENEPLVETSFIVQHSIFLFNLNNRVDNFTVFQPGENASDFFISEVFSEGTFLVEDEFIQNLAPQLTLSSQEDNLSIVNNGVVISKRLLRQLELSTNQTFKTGDKIDFAVATEIMDPEEGETSVSFYEMIRFYNFTINAIYDRKVQRNLLYPYFFPESLGDGIFISRSHFNTTTIKKIETDVVSPRLFIRFNRDEISKLNIFTVSQEIEALAFRIETNNMWIYGDTYTDEIDVIITNYENSQVIILFLFVPIIIVSALFFFKTTSYLLEQRKDEIELLRLKGSPFRSIMTIFVVEFFVLSFFGVTLGIIGGLLFAMVISTGEGFLRINLTQIPTDFISTALLSWQTWLLSAIIVGSVYVLIGIQKTRSILFQLQGAGSVKSGVNKTRVLSRRRVDILVLAFTIVAFVLVLQSDIINRLSVDSQFVGLYLVIVSLIWFLLGTRLTPYVGDFLPRMTALTKLIFKAKTKVITMSFIRKRPQILSIITLIILTTSLGIFSVFFAQTIDHNSQKNIDYLIGSDFKVFTEETTRNYSLELDKINGVANTTSITQSEGQLGRYSVTLIGIDPNKYLSTAYWSHEPIVAGGSIEDILKGLETNNNSGMIINDFLASTLQLKVGDQLNTTGLLGTVGDVWNFTVAGILTSAPGIGKFYSEGFSIRGFTRLGGIVLINQDLMDIFRVVATRIFLIRTESLDSNIRSMVKEDLKSQPLVREVIESTNADENYFDFLEISGVAGILSVDFALAIFIATIGVSTFYSYIISNRLREYAILRACGGTKNHIIMILLSETILTIFFGVVLGVILGTGFSIIFITVVRNRLLLGGNIFKLELIASPILLISIILAEFLILILVSVISAKKVRNVNVANLMRNL